MATVVLLPSTLLALLLPGDSLRISELHFAPVTSSLEFIEIMNVATAPAPLSDLSIADERRVPSAVPDPGYRLDPGASVVLVRDAAAFDAVWPGAPRIQVEPWPALNNDGDDVVLLLGTKELDRVPYRADWGERGRSLEKRDPRGPSGLPLNWGASVDPSGATPGLRNSLHAPDRTAPALLLAERTSPDAVTALFSEPVLIDGAVFLVDGSVLEAGPVEETLDEVLVAVDPARDALVLTATGVRDLFGNTLAGAHADIALPARPGSLVLSEVLSRPDRTRRGSFAFVELVSLADRPLTLRGLRLEGEPDLYGLRASSSLPRVRGTVPPDGRAVLFDAERRTDADSLLRATFRVPPEAMTVSVPGWPLGRDPAEIRIVTTSGSVIDSVLLSQGWHDPALGSGEGRSLERIRPAERLSGPAQWTSSVAPEGATPGSPNRAEATARGRRPGPADLRITEILYEPGGVQPEFVEIGSIADEPVDPNGVHLFNRPSGSEPDSVRVGYAPDAIRAGEALVLVWALPGSGPDRVADDLEAAFPASAARLPTSRIRPATGARSLRNDGSLLVLRSSDGTELDRVEYGASLHHPAVGDPRGVSLERIDWLGASDEPSNWTSSTHPEGASPGFQHGIPTGSRPPGRGGLSVEPRVFTPDGDELSRTLAIRFRLHDGPSVTDVRVFDLSGRLVRVLADGRLSNGADAVWWNGLDERGLPLPTSPYVILVRSWNRDGGMRQAKTLVVLARR